MFHPQELQKSGISVILGSFNRRQYLPLTIETIRNELEPSGIPYEIIVIDGGSTDGTIQWLVNQKDIISIIQHNRGLWRNKEISRRSWGFFINLGFRSAHGKYICMLSDDCLVIPNAIINGYHLFERKLAEGENCGALAFSWRDWPLMKNYALHYFYGVLNLNHGLYRKSALEEIGYADEKTYSFYCGDVDIIYNLLTHGYIVQDSPDSYIEHYSHANISNRAENLLSLEKDKKNFKEKWIHGSDTIASVDWEKGDEIKTKEYQDSANTISLFFPYARMYRIGQFFMKKWDVFRFWIGEERLNRLGLADFKNQLSTTQNKYAKMLEFLVYNTK